MIALQLLGVRDQARRFRPRRLAERRKEALLLVRGVARSRGPEVGQSLFHGPPGGAAQRSSALRAANLQHHPEEPLDPAMAVAQQPERLVERMIRSFADLDGQGVTSGWSVPPFEGREVFLLRRGLRCVVPGDCVFAIVDEPRPVPSPSPGGMFHEMRLLR